MILIVFYVFLGAESDSGICFYPSRLDFAVPEVAIFQYVKEWHYSVQQNLDVMGKNECQNLIQRLKKQRKQTPIVYFKIIFSFRLLIRSKIH